MRPKSPFLENLRKKTPTPQMQNHSAGADRSFPSATPTKPVPQQSTAGFTANQNGSEAKGFVSFDLLGGQTPQFVPFQSTLQPPKETAPSEPKIDIEAERSKAFQEGYQKAKQEYAKYQQQAMELEKGFQEILQNMEKAREVWIEEVRMGVAEVFSTSLHHIAKHERLQFAILSQKLSEAMEQFADEKKMKVIVAPEFVDFAKRFLSAKPNWSVEESDTVGGGAILESENGVWDARLQVTLDEIDDALTAWLTDMSK